jgi:hypothetical protein
MKNFIFASMGSGSGVVPFREEPGRNWELVELLWHPREIAAHEGRTRHHLGRVLIDTTRNKRKFVCFGEAWQTGQIPRDAAAYAILDDDLTPVHGWSATFELFEQSGLVIAQPALTFESTRVWGVTHEDPQSLWRETNFVEVMAPIFRRDVIEEMIPLFLEEPNGWGLEAYWSTKIAPIGVLDATPIVHTRPVGSADSLSDGMPAEQLATEFRTRHGLQHQNTLWPGRTLRRIPRPQARYERTSE